MASRMDKYHSDSTQTVPSRFQKNEHLYEELYANKTFTEFTSVDTGNAIELDSLSSEINQNKRENYQKSRALYPEKENNKINYDFENSYENSIDENITERNYNINDILDEARKKRTAKSESEKQRHFKTVEYNILSDLSQEKLKEYREKKQKLSKDEEENLEELIHTITSNSLRKKIDDELLSDLLPTEESETLVSPKLLEDIEKNDNNDHEFSMNESEIKENTNEYQMDQSFYTKSMDLSKEDFDFSDDEDRSFLEDAKMKTSKKIIIILFVLVIISIIGCIIYRFI